MRLIRQEYLMEYLFQVLRRKTQWLAELVEKSKHRTKNFKQMEKVLKALRCFLFYKMQCNKKKGIKEYWPNKGYFHKHFYLNQ